MELSQLLHQCKKGNAKAQKALYDSYAPQMLGVCYRYTKSMEDAEDVLQEGFIKVFRNIDQYRGEGDFGGWVRRIMVNTALAFLKKSRHYQYDMMLEDENLHPVYNESPDVVLQAKQIVAMVRQLPAGYQTIFNLHAIEGYSHVEIAKMMGISEGTSRSQYMRARNLLINWMKNFSEEKKMMGYA